MYRNSGYFGFLRMNLMTLDLINVSEKNTCKSCRTVKCIVSTKVERPLPTSFHWDSAAFTQNHIDSIFVFLRRLLREYSSKFHDTALQVIMAVRQVSVNHPQWQVTN